MDGIAFAIVLLAALILQISMIVTFFGMKATLDSMNGKLKRMEHYIYLTAHKAGAVEWTCWKCHATNDYWLEKCLKCEAERVG